PDKTASTTAPVALDFIADPSQLLSIKQTKTVAKKTGLAKPINNIPAIRLDMIQFPEQTLILTEQASSNNLMWGYQCAVIHNVREHLDERAIPIDKYHGGKFNYLMVDGHVEALSPAQSAGNIWTIRPDD